MQAKAEEKGVAIKVSDNGIGFAPDNVSGFGLLGMRERVEGLGGDFAIETNLNTGTSMNGAAKNGTTIYAWIPLR